MKEWEKHLERAEEKLESANNRRCREFFGED